MTPAVAPNKGTPQFWKLFHDTVHGPNTPHAHLMVGGEGNPRKRTQNKLELLEKMRSSGVWLVDASVTALYHRGSLASRRNDYRAVLQACWDAHIGEAVCGCNPSAVVIVGQGVGSAIGDRVRAVLGGSVEVITINQPNARMSKEAITRDRHTCSDLCRRHLVVTETTTMFGER